MISEKNLVVAAGRLMLMPFFPFDPLTKMGLLDELTRIVETDEQLEWLVTVTLVKYRQWPGAGLLRALYCTRFKPLDGIEAYDDEEPPSAKELPQLALPEGCVASKDRRADIAMRIALTAQRQKDAVVSGPATAEEIAAAPEWLRRLEGYE